MRIFFSPTPKALPGYIINWFKGIKWGYLGKRPENAIGWTDKFEDAFIYPEKEKAKLMVQILKPHHPSSDKFDIVQI